MKISCTMRARPERSALPRHGGQRGVVLPVEPRAAFEVIQPELALEAARSPSAGGSVGRPLATMPTRGEREPTGWHLPQQAERQAPSLLEPHRTRNPGALTRQRCEPFLRQEPRAETPRSHAGPQRGSDSDLAIGDLAERATVLARDADRRGPRDASQHRPSSQDNNTLRCGIPERELEASFQRQGL